MLNLIENEDEFKIELNGRTLINHSAGSPFVYIGRGEAEYKMYRGNFDIENYLESRIPLKYFEIEKKKNNYLIKLKKCSEEKFSLELRAGLSGNKLKVEFIENNLNANRFWLRINAKKEEKIYGCGEQLSYFNLRGKNFPLWTSEPGVGRNKNTYTTWQADVKDKAGGDYYTTNYPQPTFISTDKYYCHLESTAYLDFNFKNEEFHELEVWEMPEYLLFETGDNYLELLEKLTAFFGRQPELPEWVYNGLILGIQGGTEFVLDKKDELKEKGLKLSALWCQDWEGVKHTSFGKRLNWNWKWDQDLYPELDQKIKELKEEEIRFMGYINPYVLEGKSLYQQAVENDYLAYDSEGDIYLVDFGEFYCGVVDFTNPEAFNWYKKVIKEKLIEFGLDGWMADFGEYLPTDCVLANGKSAEIMHNAWPAIWAKLNYEAVKEAGKLEEVLYFMRAGFTGNQKYCTLMWAGDQSVNWSLDDGLASVIPAALSMGMSGCGLHHSDIGGYTSLHGNIRSRELFMRWAEMAAFTPVMRTHEGNRPDDNFQFYDDEKAIKHLKKMTDVYTKLKSYIKDAVKENSERGIPVQRPLFLHYEEDEKTYDLKYQYLLGRDILVAPVYKEDKKEWSLYLPEDNWVHFWTGKENSGGEIKVKAPLGQPPVFYRKNSKYRELFEEASEI
ncbi:alpha-glucosidase [Halanaerobium saccharolyticum]|uniref:Alpha-glucosidase n=1 Tax=Halanaerobium saccharolyticum TaxID=43595 RepID=A0A4V3CYS7_9FIRM|nr:alpha-glucosidase [Halanaerobium saccharolyticum]TDP95318.1 alpha-glucosidase [Halanaerobium saccharolyticum]